MQTEASFPHFTRSSETLMLTGWKLRPDAVTPGAASQTARQATGSESPHTNQAGILKHVQVTYRDVRKGAEEG